jgi:radical SAM superfamily enzyme YgiQ (UPF0313 family)
MARFVFISLYDEFAPGARTLLSTLKKAGHFAVLICYKSYTQTPIEEVTEFYQGMHIEVLPSGDHINSYSYPATLKEDGILTDLLKKLKPDIIGFSMTYSQKIVAKRLNALIRKEMDVPIVWGGPHPTTDTEECIKSADYVCRGEAEDVVLDISKRIDEGKSFTDVPNLWARLPNGEIIRNQERKLRNDVDAFSFPDYSEDSVFFIDNDELSCGKSFPKSDLNSNYIVLTTRGCPFSCSYCYQSYMKQLYKGQKAVRERSIDNVIEELKAVKKRMGHFYLEILDNVFTLKENRVKEFCEKYHKEINEPFWCYTHPRCCKDNIIRHLAECPNFEYIIMGIESASTKIGADLFNRDQTPEIVLEATRVLNKYGIRAFYDLITNVPGETEEDCRANLDLIRSLPKPFRIRLSKLSLFPNYEVDRETEGKSKLVTPERYRVWNALYFLAQDVNLSDEEVDAILNDKLFEKHPEILEKMIEVYDSRFEDITTLKIMNRLKTVELECAGNREHALQGKVIRMMERKGMKQFLWMHEKAKYAKKRVKNLI